jgi:hypothetical protein
MKFPPNSPYGRKMAARNARIDQIERVSEGNSQTGDAISAVKNCGDHLQIAQRRVTISGLVSIEFVKKARSFFSRVFIAGILTQGAWSLISKQTPLNSNVPDSFWVASCTTCRQPMRAFPEVRPDLCATKQFETREHAKSQPCHEPSMVHRDNQGASPQRGGVPAFA